MALCAAALVFAASAAWSTGPGGTAAPVTPLRPVASFEGIRDPAKRSAALFAEAGKVIQSPRCLNCHPAARIPTQGDEMRQHVPLMVATDGNHGPRGLPCATCHGADNAPTFAAGIASVPGNAHWQLAPVEMAWQGLNLPGICAQLKDPRRNGSRSLDQIVTHMKTDHLVGWAWNPGAGRTSAPGTQEGFGALIEAWVKTGAHCPAA
ncbi:Isoquinoline 1-oxidoreductase subunit [Sphingobium sp. Sx8-8]|uniref:Isoquinoline 1-oxidoreductase subunit n=1 Tax=Sphingobium sp. Sx8-8 TaxID=2933617 RepID=UPI001F58C5D5|nr:Isoquinoline 1-oxidoreductase subunit [Sphingobium sp. Sx8-8]